MPVSFVVEVNGNAEKSRVERTRDAERGNPSADSAFTLKPCGLIKTREDTELSDEDKKPERFDLFPSVILLRTIEPCPLVKFSVCWDPIPKPEFHSTTALSELFNRTKAVPVGLLVPVYPVDRLFVNTPLGVKTLTLVPFVGNATVCADDCIA